MSQPNLIILGASTGGPNVLSDIYSELGSVALKVPVVIVVHFPKGSFAQNMANKLKRVSKQPIHLAKPGLSLKRGNTYICPGGRHLEFSSGFFSSLKIALNDKAPEQNCKPSINVTLRSAEVRKEITPAAIILSGIGDDGTEGAKVFHKKKYSIYVQEPGSCVADSMPKSLVKNNLHTESLLPSEIAQYLRTLQVPASVNQRKVRGRVTNMVTPSIKTSSLAAFAPIFQKLFGNNKVPMNGKSMEMRLEALRKELEIKDFEALMGQANKSPDVMNRVVDVITNHESFFFRDKYPFEFLSEHFAKEKNKSLKVWSCACALGQEIYSLKYSLDKALPTSKNNYIASDVSSVAVQKAKKGIYSKLQVDRGLDQHLKLEMTDLEKGQYKIKDRYSKGIQFLVTNLMDDTYSIKEADVILCRYVLIYFDEITKMNIINKLISSCKEGGFLIFDPPTSLKIRSSKLKMIQYKNHKIFQKIN